MPIEGLGLSNKIANTKNFVENFFGDASNTLENLTSTVSASLGNIWEGGFAGIGVPQITDILIPAITTYCNTIQAKIDEFNADADVSITFAGTRMQEAVKEFITSVKELLKAYVSAMNVEKDRVYEAYNAWSEGTTSVVSNVSNDANSIRNAASNIKLD